MIEEIKKIRNQILFLLFLCLVTTINGILCHTELKQSVMIGIVSCMVGSLFLWLFLGCGDIWKNEKITKWMILMVTAWSVFLLGVSAKFPVEYIALASILFLAKKESQMAALLLHVWLVVFFGIYVFWVNPQMERFLCFIVLGVVVAGLYSKNEEKGVEPYIWCILFSSYSVLYLVSSKLSLQTAKKNSSLFLIGLIQLVLPCGVSFILDRWGHQEELQADCEKKILEQITNPYYELLIQLQKYSEELYEHSLRIGEVSKDAIAEIGGNTLLAKAGGCYHEIGRIKDQENYMEAGLELLQEYEFPQELIDVISQHSTGFELPQSREAAVVMLSDCILSTSEYLEEQGKRDKITDEALVSGIFTNRIKKGNLAQSGLTEREIENLKTYFINYEKQQHIA